MTLPEHAQHAIAQRQRQRTRCAQTAGILLADDRMATMAGTIITQAITLLQEDTADLNGTPSINAAITVERTTWDALATLSKQAPHCTPDDLQRAHEHIETIKRTIDVQRTLIDLAIPNHHASAPNDAQARWNEDREE